MGSYLLTLEGARKILQWSSQIYIHIDHFLGMLSNLEKIKICALKESNHIFDHDDKNVENTILHLPSKKTKLFDPSDFFWDENTQSIKMKEKKKKSIVYIKSSNKNFYITLGVCIFLILVVLALLFVIFKLKKN